VTEGREALSIVSDGVDEIMIEYCEYKGILLYG